jgi:hypothetical protein
MEEGRSKLKIWRYVDFAKFVDMLATRSLYFACTSQMSDPYEGWMPRSHIAALASMHEAYLKQLKDACDAALVFKPGLDPAAFDGILEDARRKFHLPTLLREVNLKFGLSCWHINDDESEAMWRLYSSVGSGIAIESTDGKLKASLPTEGIVVDRVRYMNFERDEIEKGHPHYGLFIKRTAFEHEKELRATLLLPTPGEGAAVPCDLESLIVNIHIAPEAPPFYASAVQYVLDRSDLSTKPPVLRSQLLEQPTVVSE